MNYSSNNPNNNDIGGKNDIDMTNLSKNNNINSPMQPNNLNFKTLHNQDNIYILF